VVGQPCTFARMTDNGLAALHRRYKACCNEHRFEDLAQFVAHDVVINGTDRGLDAYAEGLRAVVAPSPDDHWDLRHLLVDPPWIAAHWADTRTHRGPFFGVPATDRSVSTQEFASYRIDGDQITEVWGTAFDVHLSQQIRQHSPTHRRERAAVATDDDRQCRARSVPERGVHRDPWARGGRRRCR
jgi:predicted ester cyclase